MPTTSQTSEPSPTPTATAAIPSCALDDAGRREQSARYQRIAVAVRGLERRPEAIVVEFDARLDRQILEQALAVERECCPFFVFEHDEPGRRLRITVREAAQLPALEALAAAFAAVRPAPAGGEV